MTFVQIVDFETDRMPEMQDLIHEYEQQARSENRPIRPRRRMVVQDRDRPNHYMAIVEFDSYEDAMANSNLPQTSHLAEQMTALETRPPVYINCEMLESKDL